MESTKSKAFLSSSRIFNSSKMDSKVKSANVKNSERWLGYFFGPGGVLMLNGVMTGYLNIYWTDVAKISGLMGGAFILLCPIISKIIDAITNVIMGQIIDHTKCRQGKARPWLLLGFPFIVIAAILSFSIPKASPVIQMIWIAFTYNLYFSIGYTMYFMSHNMLVPLSTRNEKQRDGVAMISNMGQCLIPGAFLALFFPMLVLPAIGVDPKKWLLMAVFFSLFTLPCVMLEYFFTKERVMEEVSEIEEVQSVSLKEQIKGCFSSRYWIMIILVQIIFQFITNIQNTSLTYYCNWVLGTYNDGHTQAIVSAIGNAPLGLGILIMWPLVKKFGKRNVMVSGLAIAVAGGLAFCLNAENMGWVLVTLIIRAFGALPMTYIGLALLSDSMDHVEYKAGYRCDGFSMSVYTVVCTVAAGLGQGFFNLGMNIFGYIPPNADGTWVEQSQAVKNYFTFGYQGLFAIGMFLIMIIFLFWKLEKELPGMQEAIVERHRKEAEEKGIEWHSSEELAKMEQEKNNRIAEEKRIAELKERCEKKGLNYEEEERKYQEKLHEKEEKKKKKGR